MKKEASKISLKSTETVSLLKKDFREQPAVEKFYKIIFDYRLRKEAYKEAIKVYLKKHSPKD